MSRTYKIIPITGKPNQQWGKVCGAGSHHNTGRSCCPVCGETYAPGAHDSSSYLRFLCGGGWKVTVDRDGQPIWTGRCGAPLQQQLLTFKETADANTT